MERAAGSLGRLQGREMIGDSVKRSSSVTSPSVLLLTASVVNKEVLKQRTKRPGNFFEISAERDM